MNLYTLIAAIFTAMALIGCATQAFDTNISGPQIAAGTQLVLVTDERAELQIGMMTVGVGGGGVIQLQPHPPLSEALQAYLATRPTIDSLKSVRIERLDLKAKIGFMTVNDITCEIESWAVFKNELSPRRIRTVARNNTDS